MKAILLSLLLLTTLVAMQEAAFGATVTATVTGTVTSGTDVSGIFLAPGASFNGQSFVLTYTFDDTMGQQLSSPGYSEIRAQGTSNPGTAILKINDRAYIIGIPRLGNSTPSGSQASRYGEPTYSSNLYFLAQDGFYTAGSAIVVDIDPLGADTITDASWEADYSSSELFTESAYFLIGEENGDSANGELAVSTVTINGRAAVNPGSSLSALNPYALYAARKLAPPTLDLSTVLSSPAATSLAADGQSAVVLVYESTSSVPVTFSVSGSGNGLASGATVGTIAPFDPGYLESPNPAAGSSQSLSVLPYNCDQFGNCTFLALLWGPLQCRIRMLPRRL